MRQDVRDGLSEALRGAADAIDRGAFVDGYTVEARTPQHAPTTVTIEVEVEADAVMLNLAEDVWDAHEAI